MQNQLEHTWPQIQAELRRSVTDSTYHLWLAPLKPRALDGELLLVGAPDEIRTWVADRFSRVLDSCARTVLGPAASVRVVALDEPLPDGADPASEDEANAIVTAPRRAGGAGDDDFNPKYTFDQFVIGDGNRLAHAAALAVAELPGQAYNPLFIYGPPGLGKTHLLHAIGNYVRDYGDGLAVRYTTIEAFTNSFIQALNTKAVDDFKRRYRDTDILLIDDVQFLESKAKTEEEFFHTFNALYETGSQLVVTSDRMPRDMNALADRLRERFESGLVTDIRPPDLATRMTILRKRVQHDGIRLSDPDAIAPIADRITTNIRALQGALIRVVAFHSLTGRAIDTALVTHVLDGLYPGATTPRQRTVAEIQEATCERLGVSPEALTSPDRSARVAWARQVAMYLARELTDETLPAIGRAFGGRNHTTVLHACRRATERMASDAEAYELVRGLTARLQQPDADRGS
ncbi:chromosomal replication initiator protein DnaA [Conexibacter sp. JD483]|uniref:chromosomal replication initiator protein DnaA n=1 Tax=unclassified Conexibacter TaxID=2627773 RepID=UPI00272636BF|nr:MULTISPECIES: chromosomal replication initiator protein DnaA [unclassified Conexibacter]MDO8184446.1 chromosomal replication initiator protein DnaA [Conexibacter sp. CPCC 205706]MDO8197752.1 chromosomal replication initiator protein DnaA [Conexibacter sp. CPCC 205762]MDR9368112.1 chromosomal replication initiator protein DnaA [Conexibacter sp. JD483]